MKEPLSTLLASLVAATIFYGGLVLFTNLSEESERQLSPTPVYEVSSSTIEPSDYIDINSQSASAEYTAITQSVFGPAMESYTVPAANDDVSETSPDDSPDMSYFENNVSYSGNAAGNTANFYAHYNPQFHNTTDTYVLNENSGKIHLPSCAKVELIAEENYATSNKSLNELYQEGYTPCGICKPDEVEY